MALPSNIVKVKFLEPSNPSWKIGKGDILDYYTKPEKYVAKTKQQRTDYLDYMENPEKSLGAFDDKIDCYNDNDKEMFRRFEEQTKANGSPKYIGVLSFDNAHLEENGLLKDGELDTRQMRQIVRSAMSELIHESHKLDDDNCYWCASIHLNTDNIHVHFSLLEHENRVDRKQKYKDGNCLEQHALESFKSKVFNEITRSNQNKHKLIDDLNKLQRDILLPQLSSNFSNTDVQIIALATALPPDKQWQYNRRRMFRYRKQIDSCIDNLIAKSPDLKAIWDKYNADLQQMDSYYQKAYGITDKEKYSTHQLADFYQRAGNSLLNFMKQQDFDVVARQRVVFSPSETAEPYLSENEVGEFDSAQRYGSNYRANIDREPYLSEDYMRLYVKKLHKALDKVINLQGSIEEQSKLEYKLGKAYLSEDIKDLRLAQHYLTLSAEKDNPYALYKLGSLCLHNGFIDDGVKWLTLSADRHNNRYALYKLGKVYLDKKLPIYDRDKGIDYLTRASEQGLWYAQAKLKRVTAIRGGYGRKYQAERFNSAISELHKANRCASQVYQEMMAHLHQLMREYEIQNNLAR